MLVFGVWCLVLVFGGGGVGDVTFRTLGSNHVVSKNVRKKLVWCGVVCAVFVLRCIVRCALSVLLCCVVCDVVCCGCALVFVCGTRCGPHTSGAFLPSPADGTLEPNLLGAHF